MSRPLVAHNTRSLVRELRQDVLKVTPLHGKGREVLKQLGLSGWFCRNMPQVRVLAVVIGRMAADLQGSSDAQIS